MSAHEKRSSSSMSVAPIVRTPSSSRYGSETATLTSRLRRRAITRRPVADAPITPTRRPRVPSSPVGPTPVAASRPRDLAVPIADSEHVLGDHDDRGEGELGDGHGVGRRGARHVDAVLPGRGCDGVLDAPGGVGQQLQLRHARQQSVVEHVASPTAHDDLDVRQRLGRKRARDRPQPRRRGRPSTRAARALPA